MKLQAGDYLYREGDSSESMFVIRSGEIAIFNKNENGFTETMRLRPGQIVGDLAFFTGTRRTSDAKATTTTEVLEVSYNLVRSQFDSVPSWLKIMTNTLANQVSVNAQQIRSLKFLEENPPLSKLVVARAWAALTLVPLQYGQRYGQVVRIEWATLRTFANLSFREVSNKVMELTQILAELKLAEINYDKSGPTEIIYKDAELLRDFLDYFTRAMTKDSSELRQIDATEYATLEVLAHIVGGQSAGFKGLVTIDLGQFPNVARKLGHPQLAATHIDLLKAYGIELEKTTTETCVVTKVHQKEVLNLMQFWRILKSIQAFNARATAPQSQAKAAV